MVGGIGKAAKSSKNMAEEIAEAAANQKASRDMNWETASTPTAAHHPNAPVAHAHTTGPYNAIPNAPPMKLDANGKLDFNGVPNAPPMKLDANGKLDFNGGKVDAPGVKADAPGVKADTPSKGWSWKQKAAALAMGGFGLHALMGGGGAGAGAAGGPGAGGLGAGGAGGMGADPSDPYGLKVQTANLGQFMTPGVGYQRSQQGGGVPGMGGMGFGGGTNPNVYGLNLNASTALAAPGGLGSVPTGNFI